MQPPPPSSIHLHPAHFNLYPAPPSSFQLLVSSLQHPHQYLNQNIARNWAISSNLRCSFQPNLGSNFWNSNPKIHFWANLGPKIQNCLFCLKIGAHSISRMHILSESRLRILKFWPQNPYLGKFWSTESKLFVFPESWHSWHLDDADSYFNISFQNCQS